MSTLSSKHPSDVGFEASETEKDNILKKNYLRVLHWSSSFCYYTIYDGTTQNEGMKFCMTQQNDLPNLFHS